MSGESPTEPAQEPIDQHWEELRQLVKSGRLQLSPAGEQAVSGGSGLVRRWLKRGAAVAICAAIGLAIGWLSGSQVAGVCVGVVLVLGFVWILTAGAPEPFDQPYLGNPALFERSYLSGAVVLDDRKTGERHLYPTEWRRIVTEITGNG